MGFLERPHHPGRRRGLGNQHVDLRQGRDLTERVVTELAVVDQRHHPAARRDQPRFDLGLRQLRVGETGLGRKPFGGEKHRVEVKPGQALRHQTADKRTRPLVKAAADQREGNARRRQRVSHVQTRDHRLNGDAAEQVRQRECGGARVEADHVVFADQRQRRARDPLFRLDLLRRAHPIGDLSARLLREPRPAVNPLEQAPFGEHVEVAANRHLVDIQRPREVSDPDDALAKGQLQDVLMTLGRDAHVSHGYRKIYEKITRGSHFGLSLQVVAGRPFAPIGGSRRAWLDFPG